MFKLKKTKGAAQAPSPASSAEPAKAVDDDFEMSGALDAENADGFKMQGASNVEDANETGETFRRDASDRDNPIGLTEAFAPLPAGEGAHAGGFSYKGDSDDEYPDLLESLEPHPDPAILNDDAMDIAPGKSPARHGKQGAGGKASPDEIPSYMRKSRRMRKVLIAAICVLVALACALGYFTFRLLQESQLVAKQQTLAQSESDLAADALQPGDARDVGSAAVKQTEVPNLVGLLGLTQDEAVEQLQHGATASVAREVSEEGNPIKSTVNVALTSEPADSRSGTPTVYLGLDEQGIIIQVGYSASVSALGYGDRSFSDIVKGDGIIEKTLREAGADVSADAVQLPEDRSEYSTYATDGKTLVKENCSFSGTADIGGVSHEWSAVLSYDYTTANASGNLADTIRTIYVYINA